MAEKSGQLLSEQATENLAASLAAAIAAQPKAGCCVLALEGDLGAGKTFFARALLRSQQVQGAVKSPTYTLIEPYQCALGTVLHLDLYRLADPEEMEYLGLQDQMESARLMMVEWPSKAGSLLPKVDLRLQLSVVADGRHWQLSAGTAYGETCLAALAEPE